MEYSQYKSSWVLDTGSSRNYVNKNTRLKNRRKVKRGITVGYANKENMKQYIEGELPFEQLPKNGNNV